MKRNKRLKRLIGSPLLKNVLALFSGKAAAQVILLASAPIIARLFTPADFGVAALLLAITFMATPVATLGYNTAAQLAEHDAEARSLLRITIATTAFFAIVITTSIGIATYISDSAFLSRFGAWIWIIPVVFVLHGIESLLESWNTRMKRFKVQASTTVSGIAVGTGSRIAFGVIGGSSVGGLVLGYVIGLVTRIGVLARSDRSSDSWKDGGHSLSYYRNLMVQYRDFPLYATPTALLKFSTKKLPLLFFGSLFSPAAAGFYAMAERLFFQPLNLLQASFRSVYTQHLVSALRKGRRLTPILLKGCLFTGGAMLPPSLLLMFYGEPGVVWLLGENWRMAGVFIEITAPLIIFASMAVPAGAAMVVCRQQRRLLVQQIVTTVIVVLGFVFSYFVWRTPEAAVRTMMVLLVVRNLYMIWISFIVVRRLEQEQPTEQGKH